MTKRKSITLKNREVSSDPAMEKVLAAQARVAKLERENKALRKDLILVLEEYNDAMSARDVPVSPSRRALASKEDSIRVYAGDVHGMTMDRDAVRAFISDLKTLSPNEVVLGGDVVDCGGWLAKHQTLGYVANTDYSYQEDIKAANWFLDAVQQAAPEATIHYVEGNHEDRVERWVVDQTMAHGRDSKMLLSHFSPRALLRLEDRNVFYYGRHDVHVNGLPPGWIKLGKMFFTHSLKYSKNAARAGVEAAAGNVTYFCTHREDTATIRYPQIGIVKAMNPGCLCRLQPIYQHSHPTTWSHGYGIHVIAKSGNFLPVHVPIQNGKSLAGSMVGRFRG